MLFNDLDQLLEMRNEIVLYERRLEELNHTKREFVGDTVKDYSTGRGRVIKIQGYASVDINQTERIYEIINQRKRKLMERVIAVEEFIDTVDNSNVRQIIELRFIRGWNWKKVASTVYGSPMEDKARKCISRFFEKIREESVQSD